MLFVSNPEKETVLDCRQTKCCFGGFFKKIMLKVILTDQNFFEEVLKSEKLVLVDFWASWCMPCQMITPIIEEIAGELEDKIKIGKLNVDENPLISSAFMIDFLPTIALFKKGKIVKSLTGVQSKEVILEAINSVIDGKDR